MFKWIVKQASLVTSFHRYVEILNVIKSILISYTYKSLHHSGDFNMEHLQLLIKGLNKSEKKMARNFLTNYGNTGKKETISLELFEILNNRTKKISNKEASLILFGKDEKNRIRVLKNRMKNKILDALTTEIVLENQEYDTSMKVSILLKKKLTQFQTLYYSKKGNLKLTLALLEEIIDKSTEYELYPILIESLNLKKQIIGFRKGIEEYELYEKLERNAIDNQVGLTKIVNSYYKILLLYRSGKTNKKELSSYIKNSIKEGEELLKTTKSKSIEHYLNIIKYAYYDELRKYIKAKDIMLKEVELLKKNKAVYRVGRLGASYDYLCQTCIRLEDYVEASMFANKGVKCFKPGSINHAVAQELEFRSLLYAGKIKEAGKVIKNMVADYKDSIDKHRRSTHRYFLACFHFENGQFKKCNQLLADPFEFKQDRTGWEFSARVLGIMASLEQNKVGITEDKYYSLFRLFERNKEDKRALSSRNNIMLDLINQWILSGGNKSIAKMKDSELLAKLSHSKNEWDPLGSELIPFHKWIESKV